MSDVIRLTRRAPVESLESLVEPINAVVRAVEAEGEFFRLSGYSPAHTLYPLVGDATRWVMCSEIEWNHGREPQDPTHNVILFNTPPGAGQSVYLCVQWVAAGEEATRPGLDLRLHLADGVEGLTADRSERLVRLFTAFIDALQPDFGLVGIADPVEGDDHPLTEPRAGWLTYLAGFPALGITPPMGVTARPGGILIALRRGPMPDSEAEIADAIDKLDRTLSADLS